MTVTDEIVELFGSRGAEAYHGEIVTQLQHGLQAAAAAERAGAEEVEILAALLHDIGHMLGEDEDTPMGVVDHDRVAMEWLEARGFGEHLATLAGGHVAAKRYLVATNPVYYDRLSPTSKETLRLQGGPMNAEEVREFEKDPMMTAMLRLRSWDEAAKDPAAAVPGLEHWIPMMERYLQQQNGR
jgi:phosphonate degradation associated HDIG domain protein